MSDSLVVTGHGDSIALVAGGTTWEDLAANGALLPFYINISDSRTIWRTPGTISKLSFSITSTNATTSVVTVRILINGTPGNQVIVVPAGAIGIFQDLINTDTIAAGDELSIQLSSTLQIGKGMFYNGAWFIFSPTDTSIAVTRAMCADEFTYTDLEVTYYQALWGQAQNYVISSANTNYRDCIHMACTAKNAGVYIGSNLGDGTVVVTLQINGVDSSITITVPVGGSGWFEDLVNTEVLVAGDLLGWKVVSNSTNGGRIYIKKFVLDLVSDEGKWAGGLGQATRTLAGGLTRYFSVGGLNRTSPEVEVAFPSLLNGQCLGLCIWVQSNFVSTESTLTFRVNGIDGNNIVAIPALTTGFFDIQATDSFLIGDLLSIKLITGTTGTLGYNSIDWVGAPEALATATLQVIKVINPSSADDFDFTTTGGLVPGTFTLADGESQLYTGLAAGTYGVTETPVAGWNTTYQVSNGNPNTGIILIAGDSVTVVVTNTLIPNQGSGIYKIVEDKRQDTLWVDASLGTTVDVKIPDPYVRLPLIGE